MKKFLCACACLLGCEAPRLPPKQDNATITVVEIVTVLTNDQGGYQTIYVYHDNVRKVTCYKIDYTQSLSCVKDADVK